MTFKNVKYFKKIFSLVYKLSHRHRLKITVLQVAQEFHNMGAFTKNNI